MTVAIGAKMLLDAAKVVEDRHKSYGPPTRNFQNIAALWNAYLAGDPARHSEEPPLTSANVAHMMVLMKVARLIETPDHLDSWTDIAGYAACGAEVSGAGASQDTIKIVAEAGAMPNIDRSPMPWWKNHVADMPIGMAQAELAEPEIITAKPNPSMPLVSEDVSEEDYNR